MPAPDGQASLWTGFSAELGVEVVQLAEAFLERIGELCKRLLSCAHQCELSLDQRSRLLHDPQPLRIVGSLLPPVPQTRPRVFGLGELDQLLERQAEQIAEPDQLLQARDVRIAVEPVCALRPLVVAAEQSKLFVVPNRARCDPDPFGHFADSVCLLVCLSGHLITSLRSELGLLVE